MVPAIQVAGLTFRYAGRKRAALNGVTFDVREGETVLVLGPSGCGKSTLALALNGMIPHVVAGELAGNVRINGESVAHRPLSETAACVGIVFQDPEAQLCMLRVDEEIAFGLENLAVASVEMPTRIRRALELTGLSGEESTRIDWLSGGNKQRLALASVLAMEPSVLIFDEPTSNLDPAGAQAVFETMGRLKAEGRHTIVIVEHRLDQLMHLVDRVLVLGPDGTLIDDGEPHQVLERQARALDEFGIWKPQVSELADALGRHGVVLRAYPITLDEAEIALRPMLLDGREAPAAARLVSNRYSPFFSKVEEPEASVREAVTVRVRGLSAAYRRGVDVLHDVHVEVRSGDILALVGPNGAGKSTLAQHLVGTLRALEGTVFIQDRDIREISQRALTETVGYVFQNPEHQFVARTVFDELAFGLRLRDRPEAEVRARVEALLADFGLAGLAAANPFKLSHGEKRRLSVATMLILNQSVLVLDEPTFGQDARHAAALLDKLRALNAAGTTLLVITHDMRLVAEHASHAAVLQDGRLLASATPDEVFADDALLSAAHLQVPPIRALSERLFGWRERLPSTVDALAHSLVHQAVGVG